MYLVAKESYMKTQDSQILSNIVILFADIAGSTRLYETLGNDEAQRTVQQVMSLLTVAAHLHKGNVVKTIGDEILCTFVDVNDATIAASEMHRALQLAGAAGSIKPPNLSVRIGFHCGPVIHEDGDVFGDAVNIAARVVAQAKRRQTITTRSSYQLLSAALQKKARFIDQVALKGKKEEMELYEIVWEETEATIVDMAFSFPDKDRMRLQLNWKGKKVELTTERPSAQLGRGSENDIVVADNLASRLHARIETRRDRYVLVDQSINGTYVQFEGLSAKCVRRDECVLQGTGVISLGRPIRNGETENCIHFVCEQAVEPSAQPARDIASH